MDPESVKRQPSEWGFQRIYQEGLTAGPASYSCSTTDVKRSREIKACYRRCIYLIVAAGTVICHYHQNSAFFAFQVVFKTKQLALQES